MRTIFLIIILCTYSTLFAQKTKKVEGSYIYRAPETVSVEQAKRIALERAQTEILATTYGTRISQQNSTRVSNNNGESKIDFLNISSSDVQGEWIETIGEPTFSVNYSDEMLIVECAVKGVVREIVGSSIDIDTKVLRNGASDKFESSEFKSGDDLFLSFQSPVDGYLAVYLIDNDNKAFCLLPYRNQTNGIYKVKGNRHYTFFSQPLASEDEKSVVDEYIMTCDKSYEANQIYVVFSPNTFVKANDYGENNLLPRELDGNDFQKWLAKVRRKDNQVTLVSKQITIKKT